MPCRAVLSMLCSAPAGGPLPCGGSPCVQPLLLCACCRLSELLRGVRGRQAGPRKLRPGGKQMLLQRRRSGGASAGAAADALPPRTFLHPTSLPFCSAATTATPQPATAATTGSRTSTGGHLGAASTVSCGPGWAGGCSHRPAMPCRSATAHCPPWLYPSAPWLYSCAPWLYHPTTPDLCCCAALTRRAGQLLRQVR